MGAWWYLVRGGNVILSGAASAAGVWLVQGRGADAAVWLLAPLAPMLITAAGNIQNDCADCAIDRVNRPERPLPAGAVSFANARRAMFWLFGAGLGTAIAAGWTAAAIAVFVVVGLNIYNLRLSRLPLTGNLAVSLMGALPILYGGVTSVGFTSGRWLIAASATGIAFWLHLSRELLKDTVDIEGDRAAGRRTLPVLRGPKTAMRAAALSLLVAAAFTLWQGTFGWYGPLYLFGIGATVLPALLLGAAQCWWRTELAVASLWTGGIKLIMLAGLIWMILAVRPY